MAALHCPLELQLARAAHAWFSKQHLEARTRHIPITGLAALLLFKLSRTLLCCFIVQVKHHRGVAGAAIIPLKQETSMIIGSLLQAPGISGTQLPERRAGLPPSALALVRACPAHPFAGVTSSRHQRGGTVLLSEPRLKSLMAASHCIPSHTVFAAASGCNADCQGRAEFLRASTSGHLHPPGCNPWTWLEGGPG